MRSPRGQLVDIVMHQYWFSPQNSQKEKKRISKAKYTMKTELVNKSTPIKDTFLKKPFFLSGSSYFPCVLCVVWTGWLPEMLTCPKKMWGKPRVDTLANQALMAKNLSQGIIAHLNGNIISLLGIGWYATKQVVPFQKTGRSWLIIIYHQLSAPIRISLGSI